MEVVCEGMAPLAPTHLWGRNKLSSMLKFLSNNQIDMREIRKQPHLTRIHGNLAYTESEVPHALETQRQKGRKGPDDILGPG